MQEAYRPPCSKYSFCCPILADPPWPDLSPLPRPDLTPPARPDPPSRPDPPQPDLTPLAGLTWPPLAGLTWPPHWTDLTPPPPRGQTNKVKLLPSRRTTYAGGKHQYHVFTANPITTQGVLNQKLIRRWENMINIDTGLSTGNVNRSLLIMDHPRARYG